MAAVIGGFPFEEKAALISPRHEFSAPWNAGDCKLIDDGIAMPPIEFSATPAEAPGSGKSGTPCARMHFENASWAPADDELVVLLWEAPPQPAASTQAAIVPITETPARAAVRRREAGWS